MPIGTSTSAMVGKVCPARRASKAMMPGEGASERCPTQNQFLRGR